MMQFEQKVLPSIQQRYVDANAGSSSALNQALSQGATDLTTGIAQQYGQFHQQQQANSLNALQGLGGLSTQQTFQPMINQSQGLAGSAIEAGGNIAAGAAQNPKIMAAITAMLSSEKVKENVKPFNKIGLKELKDFKVKQYDYIEEVGGQKDKIGLIAEELPQELTVEKDGILHVDLYALMSVMINAIQGIDMKLDELGVE